MSQTLATATCIHCSSLIPETRASSFCCAGCEAVYTLLNSRGLGEYYRLRSRSGVGPAAPVEQSQERYEFLSDPEFLADYASADGRTLRFYLEGVQCAACVWLVEKLPEFVPEAQEARLDLSRSTVSVRLHQPGSFAPVARELAAMGYAPHPIREDGHEELRRREDRILLVRAGIAAAASGNIMISAVALYAGADGTIARGLEWLGFVLCIPVLLYSALPFYRSAWASLKRGSVSIDLPISIGMIVGGAVSTLNLFRGSSQIYFDSISALVFLLLSTRYLLRRVQSQADSSARLIHFLAPSRARRIRPDGALEEVRADSLAVGDRIEVAFGEAFPVDGIVLSGKSEVGAALLTGESRPQTVSEGSQVHAGTHNLSAPLIVRVEASGSRTRLGAILAAMQEGLAHKAPIVKLLDRVGQGFVWAVLALTLAAFFVGASFSFEEGFNRAMAMAIIVCPCTFALATPLAFSLAIRRAARAGILIKDAEMVERLSRVKTLFFDKTGTLTEGRLEVLSWEPLEADATSILLALERPSRHPIAQALRRRFEAELLQTTLPSLEAYREIPGVGIEAKIGGQLCRVASLSEPESEHSGIQTRVGLWREGRLIGRLQLGDRLRTDSAAAIQQLRARGYSIRMLSGDHLACVSAVARETGIAVENALSCQTPESKGEILRTEPASLMVGDGANDSIALASAHAGIAVRGGMEVSLQAAGAYATRPGITPIARALEISRDTFSSIHRNLIFAIFYNLAGIALAFTGRLTPLAAAILMPMSALTVFLSTILGARERHTEATL